MNLTRNDLPEAPDESTSSSSAVVDSLIAKYGISKEDAALLRNRLREPSGSADDTGVRSGSAAHRVRAKAPVQLLASTRRLVEFASSKQPAEIDRVVYVCGSFDMFHVGHAQFLKDAKALGTFLLVGIHEDLTVRQSKGPSFPVMTLTERVLNVCACKWVDEVIIGAPKKVTEDLVTTWDIHCVARGCGHMRNLDCEDTAADQFKVPKEKGLYVEVDSKWKDLCHDTIVERIMTSRRAYLKRNADRSKREDAYYEQKSKDDPKEAVSKSTEQNSLERA